MAVKVAKLCILIEDFLIEAHGARADNIKPLDSEYSLEWRRMYFFRNSFRTLHEIRQAIDLVQKDKSFEQALKKEPGGVKKQFHDSFANLKTQGDILKDIRNQIGGGHVLDKAVKRGLKNLGPFEEGIIQAGDMMRNTHFKFVHKIVASSLVSVMREDDSHTVEEVIEAFLIKRMSKAVAIALELTNIIFAVYVKEKRLI